MVTHIHTLGNTDDPLPDGQQSRSRKPKRRAQRKTARHISGGPLTRVRAAVDAHSSHATEAEAVASEATSPDSLEGTRGEDNVAAKCCRLSHLCKLLYALVLNICASPCGLMIKILFVGTCAHVPTKRVLRRLGGLGFVVWSRLFMIQMLLPLSLIHI